MNLKKEHLFAKVIFYITHECIEHNCARETNMLDLRPVSRPTDLDNPSF